MNVKTCSIEGCEKPRRSSKKEVCEMHYYRHRRTGSYELLPKAIVVRPACGVEGCDRVSRVTTEGTPLCDPHYKRHWRTGEIGSAEIVVPRETRGQCVIPGCEDIDDGLNGLCKRHGTRARRHGDPLKVIAPSERQLRRGEDNPSWTGDEVSYVGVHQRVRKWRGVASTHKCADCGERAQQWSYNRAGGDRERHSEIGPYSISVDDYTPRCISCHKKFDMKNIRSVTHG